MANYVDPNEVIFDRSYVDPLEVTPVKADGSMAAKGMAFRSVLPDVATIPTRFLANSVGGLGALGYDVLSWPARKLTQDKKEFTNFPASTGLEEFSRAAFHRSKDVPYEKPIEALAAGGAGAGVGTATKAIGPIRGALAGVSGYIGGELGGDVAQTMGLPRQVGTIPGSVVGGIPTMLPGGGTAASLAKEAIKGRSPEEIRNAIALQAQYPWLRPNQLFSDSAEPLRRLESSILTSGVGKGSLEARGISQPKTASDLASSLLGRFGNETPRDLMRANEIENAVERALDFPRQHANDQAKWIYEELRKNKPQLPMADAFALADELSSVATKAGLLPKSDAGRAANRIGTQATENSLVINPATNRPFVYANRDIMSLDKLLGEVEKKINASYGLSATGADRSKAQGLLQAKGPLKDATLMNSDDLAQAKDTISRIRSVLETEVRATPLARAAPAKNAEGVLKPNARWDTLGKMIDEPMSPQDVTRLRTVLDRQDERAFIDVVANSFARKLDDAYAAHGTQGGGAAFAKSVRNMPNLDSVLVEAAKAQGLKNPQQFADGFKSALNALEASGRKLPSPGPQDLATILGVNPANVIGRALAGNELTRSAQMVGAVRSGVSRTQYGKLYSVFDDPESMRKIAELSHIPIVSPRHASLLSSIVGGQISTTQMNQR